MATARFDRSSAPARTRTAARPGEHRMRRLVAQTTTVTLLLVSLGLTGLPGVAGGSAQAATQATGVGVAGPSGTVTAWGVETASGKSAKDGSAGISAIAVGDAGTSLLLKDNATVVVGYDNGINPPDFTDVTAIAYGYGHALVLHSDGTVGASGLNSFGQTTVPSGLTGVKAIAAGGNYSMALKTDGTVVWWGQLLHTETEAAANPTIMRVTPASLTGITAIATSGSHALAVKTDGTVIGWGLNQAGQSVSSVTGVVAVSAGNSYSLALLKTGTVTGWGDNSSGQTTIPTGLTGITMIAAGSGHALALKSDGTVRAWGLNNHGQTDVPATLKNVTAIAAGNFNSMALAAVPPAITNDSPPLGATTGTAYSYTFTATGAPAPVFTVASGSLPTGLTLSGTGVLSGTPTAAGDFTFAVTADNGSVPPATGGSHTISVIAAPVFTAPVFTADSPPATGKEGTPYTYTFTASGNPAPQFTVTAGSLPTGLNLTSDGVLSGTPTADGTFGFTVTAANGQGQAAATAHSITISTPKAPGFTAEAPPATASLDAAYDYTFLAAGKPQPTFDVGEGALPDGLTLSAQGALTGTPTTAGTFTFRITASNGTAPPATTAQLTITVPGRGAPVIVDDAPPTTSTAGDSFSYRFTATGSPTPTFALSSGQIPFGLILTTDGQLVGTTTSAGKYTFTVTAGNGQSPDAVSTSHTITVDAVPGRTVVAWGQDVQGDTQVPGGLGEVAAVAAGDEHSLALRTDGTVVGWGKNNVDQSSVPWYLGGVVAVSAAGLNSMALRNDGTVVAWGSNGDGQTSVPAGLNNVTAIASGLFHSMALKNDGTVVAWGGNFSGQSSVPAGLTDVIAIAAGREHSVALKSDGTVVVWGRPDSAILAVPAGLTGVTAIAAGDYVSFAVRADGTVAAWGLNTGGELGIPAGLTDVVQVAAAQSHVKALTSDGTVVAWGNSSGPENTVPAGLAGVTSIAAGWYHTLAVVPIPRVAPALTADSPPLTALVGLDYSYAFEATGTPTPEFAVQSGTLPAGLSLSRDGVLSGKPTTAGSFDVTITATNGTAPDAVGSPHAIVVQPTEAPRFTADEPPQSATAGVPYSYTFAATGLPTPTFSVTDGVLPTGMTLTAQGVLAGTPPSGGSFDFTVSATNAAARTPGDQHAIMVSAAEEGTIVGWGDNSYGERSIPAGLVDVTAIAAGYQHSLALRSDGTVVAFGRGRDGQAMVPAGLSGVTMIAAGWAHSLALKSDGTVVAWGSNEYGQTAVPVGLTGVTAISAGVTHSVALKSDGTVVEWGTLGVGSTSMPVGLSGVIAVQAGQYVTVALKGDGTVVMWGSDGNWQLHAEPGITGMVSISTGMNITMGLTGDGTPVLVTDHGAYPRYMPPAGLAGVTAVDVNYFHALALKADGTVVAWGDDVADETKVPIGLSGVIGISAGTIHSLALVRTVSPALTADTPPGAALDEPYSYDFAATGYPAPTFAVTAGTLPAGLTLSAQGELSGTPTAQGDSTFTVTASNGASPPAVGSSHTLTVTAPPVFTADSPPNSTIKAAYSYTFTATGTPAPSFTVTSGSLPDGLTLAADGTLSGTTATGGTFGFTVTAGNGVSPDAVTKKITIVVTEAPVFTADAPPTTAGTELYFYRFEATGTPAPTFAVSSGRLPFGLVLTADGALIGTPTSAGKYTFTVTAGNGVAPEAVGTTHTITVANTVQGAVVGWGQNSSGQTDVPPGLADITAVAGGDKHSLALRADGTVVAWGDNEFGQASVPAELHNVVAIAAGASHSLALTADGTVVAWGNDADGQLAVPAGLDHVTAIVAGERHSLALRSDGTLVAWGSNAAGESTVPAGLTDVFAVTAGSEQSMAMATTDLALWGQVTLRGNNPSIVAAALGHDLVLFKSYQGELLTSSLDGIHSAPTPAGLTDVTAFATGYGHAVALQADGTLVGWGDDTFGQATVPTGLSGVMGVATGANHTLAIVPAVAPAFTADTPATAALGQAYSYAFTATGTPSPTFAVTAGTLPAGLTLAADGTLSGTPTAQGTSTLTVTADNGLAPPAVGASHTVTVTAPPVFTTDAPPPATIGAPYSYAFTATGTPAPTFAVTTGALPKGLTLSAGGLLTGTPTAGGVAEFTVTADNGISPVASTLPLTINVTGAPLFTAATPPSAVAGVPYSYTFTASGSPDPTFTMTAGTLPAGLTLSPGGVLSGTPTDAEAPSFTVTASNGVGTNAVWVVPALLVNPGVLATVIVAPPAAGGTGYPVTAGVPFTFVVDGQDSSGNPLPGQVATFSVPVGTVFPGTISGNTVTFTKAGSHTITVQVGTVTTTIEVTVAAGPPAAITLNSSTLTVKRGGSVTLAVSGTDAYGNDTGDLTGQTVFSSNWSVDVITGATVTFPHASPHLITATLGTLTSTITVEVQEPAAAGLFGGLAATGVMSAPILGGALTLLLLGLGLLLLRTRRRRAAA